MLTIRRVDPEDEKQMTAFAGIQRESELHESAHATPFTLEESREHLRNTDPSDETRGFLGYDGEVPVAAGVVELFLIGQRRQGVGSGSTCCRRTATAVTARRCSIMWSSRCATRGVVR